MPTHCGTARWLYGLILFNSTLSISLAAQPGGAPGAGGPPPVRVETAAASVEPVNDEVSAVGSLQSNETVVIRPEIAGRVIKILFREGQTVAAGDALFHLDAQEYDAQVAQSAAMVKLAELNYARANDLREKTLISQQEYDEVYAKVEESRAKLALDTSRLDKTVIRAPFNGTVGVRNVSPGAYVKPGDDLVTLEDINPIKVEFRVPETYARQIRREQPLQVRVDAYPDEAFTGEVFAIDTRMDAQTRTMLLRGRIPNSKGNLKSGMFARVALILATRSNALVVPEQAIVPMGNDAFVFRVVDGKAAQTRVQTGRRMGGKVEIRTGLQKGDVVVTAGQIKVRDGAPVAPIGAQAAPPAGGPAGSGAANKS
jgi:membrane fusion protein (multidrug efflux system)